MSNAADHVENIYNFVTDTISHIDERMLFMKEKGFDNNDLDTFYFTLISKLMGSRLLLELNSVNLDRKIPPTEQEFDELNLKISNVKSGVVEAINKAFESAFKNWNGLDCMYHTTIDMVDDGADDGILH